MTETTTCDGTPQGCPFSMCDGPVKCGGCCSCLGGCTLEGPPTLGVREVAERGCRATHPTRWEYRATSSPCDSCLTFADALGPVLDGAIEADLEALEACREQRGDLLALLDVEREQHAQALNRVWHEGYGAGSSDATDGWLQPGTPRTACPYDMPALAAGSTSEEGPFDHSRDVPPHTHGGTDAPECTTCRPSEEQTND